MHTHLHIGQVAHLLGISPKTIRYYQKIGLFAELERSASGYRLYTAQHLIGILHIRRLQTMGLSLHQIKHILGSPEEEQTLRDVLSAIDAQLEEQVNMLRARQGYIRQLLATDHQENLLDQMNTPSALITWTQDHVDHEVIKQFHAFKAFDERVIGVLEGFHWPDEYRQYQAHIQDTVMQICEQPALIEQMMIFSERFMALAEEAPDSPNIAQFVDDIASPLLWNFLQLVQCGDEPSRFPSFDAIFSDIFTTMVSPAQLRFVEILRDRLALESQGNKEGQ